MKRLVSIFVLFVAFVAISHAQDKPATYISVSGGISIPIQDFDIHDVGNTIDNFTKKLFY